MKSTCLYFENSAKRTNLLSEIVTKNVHVTKRSPLLDLCKTRWASRHSAYQHFYQSYKFLVMSLRVIGLGLHQEELSADFKSATWDRESKDTATSLVNGITEFDFLVGFLTVYQFLSHLGGVTVKLQSRSLDIIKAYQEIDDIKSLYASIRSRIDVEFHKVYQQAERMGSSVNVHPSKPRSCAHQTNRPNAPAESLEDWYRINVAIPFIDHVITELDSKFTRLAKTASQLLSLVPSVMCDSNVNFSELIELYEDDLPSPELFDQEFSRWQHKFQTLDKKPSSCASAIKECDKDLFPNIFILLQIACTIPVTSCECERNASALRRLHTFMRTTMKEERLTDLALMHIHYERAISLDQVVNIFTQIHPRRLKFSSLLYDIHEQPHLIVSS